MYSKRRVGGGYKYIPVKPSKKDNEKTNLYWKAATTNTIWDSIEQTKDNPVQNTTLVSPRKSFDRYPVLGSPPSSNGDDDVFKDNQQKGEQKLDNDEKEQSQGEIQAMIPGEQQGNYTLPLEDSFSINYNDTPILRLIQDNVIGHLLQMETPFGKRGKDFIRIKVFPYYANTHSTTGFNARQTGKYREESRDIIRKCVNAGRDDAVIFTGSGATSGIHKVAWGLKMNNPRVASETVVFIGPYEHHSNILPWREYGVHIVRIHENKKGMVDMDHLKSELMFWKEKRRYLVVSTSAASNVTGIITDTEEVARIAHKYGALAVFDYAAGGPYLDIDMNPSRTSYKDAVIISTHKFVGGPGTPGIVVAKRWMFRNSVPHNVGGGTVTFVTKDVHTYASNIEEREEGGTPAIIESIRAGLVFKLKSDVGVDVIHKREQDLCRRAFGVWKKNPNMIILGNHNTERVPIFSFMTLHAETGRLVHFNYISTLLSDLFGIQARGGCACAGPYAQDLMGMSVSMTKKFSWFLCEKSRGQDPSHPDNVMGIMRPGFTRINLPYFYDDDVIDYIIQAVDLVNRHGWKLLPKYEFDINDASWRHVAFTSSTNGTDLGSLDAFSWKSPEKNSKQDKHGASELSLTEAALERSRYLRKCIPKDKRHLRFFLTPLEASEVLSQDNTCLAEKKKYPLPFKFKEYYSTEGFSYKTESNESAESTQRSAATTDDVRGDKEHKTEINLSKMNDSF